jgi:ferredoxin, 2Fe-2S
MPEIIFETADGTLVSVDAKAGESVMRAAVAIGVQGIDADCGGGMAIEAR